MAGDISFPNLECSLSPLITDSLVQYTSIDQRFAVLESQPLAGSTSSVPNETVDAIRQSYYLAVSSWVGAAAQFPFWFFFSFSFVWGMSDTHVGQGNMMIDTLYDTVLTNTTTTFAAAMEASLTGIIEFEGSNLRLYYAANEAPGRRDVNGTYRVWRVGYGGQAVTLASLLPPLAVVAGMAAAYAALGARTGRADVSALVDPMSSTWLVAASATGAGSGRLRGLQGGIARPRDARVLALGVGFEREHGLVNDSSRSLGLQEFLIAPPSLGQETPYKGAVHSSVSELDRQETPPQARTHKMSST